jgi:hypothetical protein
MRFQHVQNTHLADATLTILLVHKDDRHPASIGQRQASKHKNKRTKNTHQIRTLGD